MKRNINNNIELKPCPFCGGNSYIDLALGHLYINCSHKNTCPSHCDTWLHSSSKDIYTQIKEWNERSDI